MQIANISSFNLFFFWGSEICEFIYFFFEKFYPGLWKKMPRDREFFCQECNKKFSISSNYSRHLKDVHNVEHAVLAPIEYTFDSYIFKCLEGCQTSYATTNRLIDHLVLVHQMDIVFKKGEFKSFGGKADRNFSFCSIVSAIIKLFSWLFLKMFLHFHHCQILNDISCTFCFVLMNYPSKCMCIILFYTEKEVIYSLFYF